jgi:hypothetical protein
MNFGQSAERYKILVNKYIKFYNNISEVIFNRINLFSLI